MTDLEQLATEWARLHAAQALARTELGILTRSLSEVQHDLEAALTVGEAVAAGRYGHVAYVLPPAKGAARVIPAGVTEYSEQLRALGLVVARSVDTKPGVRELRSHAAQLAAHGVPLSALLLESVAHAELELVPTPDVGH